MKVEARTEIGRLTLRNETSPMRSRNETEAWLSKSSRGFSIPARPF
jgi:hypothetical protein